MDSGRRACYAVRVAFRPMMLRAARVLARCDESGELVSEGGRVEIRYKPKDGRSYRAAKDNLSPIAGAALLSDADVGPADAVAPAKKGGGKGRGGGGASTLKEAAKAAAATRKHADGTIVVYADGACSGNPGPCGLGVVMQDGAAERELSEYLGEGTNNIAELTAGERAADAVDDAARPVRIHTDSSYSIGVLSKGWKAKANQSLVARVKKSLARLEDVELVYVPGHAGVELNERADRLARLAVDTRGTTGWKPPK